MTTSPDCNVDIENITINLRYVRSLSFEKLIWDDLSVKTSLIIEQQNFDLIQVSVYHFVVCINSKISKTRCHWYKLGLLLPFLT